MKRLGMIMAVGLALTLLAGTHYADVQHVELSSPVSPNGPGFPGWGG